MPLMGGTNCFGVLPDSTWERSSGISFRGSFVSVFVPVTETNKTTSAQNKSRQRLTLTASLESGENGIRGGICHKSMLLSGLRSQVRFSKRLRFYRL